VAKNRTPTLIVTRPGSLQSGLQALMTTIPQIGIVGQACNAEAALRMVTTLSPELVLLDTDLPDDETWIVLRQIKTRWPRIQCVVLADNVRHQQEAEVAGADVVLLKGLPPAKLIANIEELLL
jgi:two-component system response regulator DevR